MKLIAVFLVLIFFINETIGFSDDSVEDNDKWDDFHPESRFDSRERDEVSGRNRKKPKRRSHSKWDDDISSGSEERKSEKDEESKRNRKKPKKHTRPITKWDDSSLQRNDDDTTRDPGKTESERNKKSKRNRKKPKKHPRPSPKWDDDTTHDTREKESKRDEESGRNRKKPKKRQHSSHSKPNDFPSHRRRGLDIPPDTGEKESKSGKEGKSESNKDKPKRRHKTNKVPPKIHVDEINPVTGDREVKDGESASYHIVVPDNEEKARKSEIEEDSKSHRNIPKKRRPSYPKTNKSPPKIHVDEINPVTGDREVKDGESASYHIVVPNTDEKKSKSEKEEDSESNTETPKKRLPSHPKINSIPPKIHVDEINPVTGVREVKDGESASYHIVA